jgi:hypothetical protein
LSGQHIEDLGDQGGVCGALPGVALKQLRGGSERERQEHAIGFGEFEGILEGAGGGRLIAERIPCDRLEHESLAHPGDVPQRDGAVEDGCEQVSRGLRIILGEPERRRRDAHLAAFPLLLVQLGESVLGPLHLA